MSKKNKKDYRIYTNHQWEPVDPKDLALETVSKLPTDGKKAFVSQMIYKNLAEILSANDYESDNMVESTPVQIMIEEIDDTLSKMHSLRRKLITKKQLQGITHDNEIDAILSDMQILLTHGYHMMEYIDHSIDVALDTHKHFQDFMLQAEQLIEEWGILLDGKLPHKDSSALTNI